MKHGGAEYLQYRLQVEPQAAQRARRVVGAVVSAWQLGALADDVVSCMSELVANVYEHATTSPIVELFLLWVPGDFLSAEVRDQDMQMPRRTGVGKPGLPFALIDPDANDPDIMHLPEAGRGLALVEALCDRLIWRPDSSGGKLVRCYWRLKAATDTARNCPPPSTGPLGTRTDPSA
ncbi:MAG TPA: ATP-binding protein [Trebonia sp.]|jgi:anti-sigma regulatory factor (Ser/Thr protein kinase)|nr:ATP-binding protein [Trebonia sp.]